MNRMIDYKRSARGCVLIADAGLTGTNRTLSLLVINANGEETSRPLEET
jgi:hypothetical protein